MKECLRVTEILGCKRKLWLDKNHDIYHPYTHPVTKAGSELHNAIATFLEEGLSEVPKLSDNNQYRFNNFLTFWDNKELSGNDTFIEKRYFTKDNAPRISGKMDLIDDGILYDWKSGKVHRITHRVQLNAYTHILQENGIDIRKMILVYLGNDYPMALTFEPDEKRIQFFREYDKAIEAIESIKIPYSHLIEESNFACLFCEQKETCLKYYYMDKE